MIRPFRFHEPATLEKANELKRKKGDGAAFYAGGTELLLVLKEDFVVYSDLIHLKAIEGLRGIEVEDDHLRIGALTRHAEVARDPRVRERLPALSEMAAGIGNVRVRAAGTLGGNLAFAEPHSDPGALLLALDAVVRTVGVEGERTVPASEFWLGPFETALEDGEIVTKVEIPLRGKLSGAAYRKFAVSELPTAGVGVFVHLSPDVNHVQEARLVVSSVNPVPTRLKELENVLQGRFVKEVEGFSPEYWAEAATSELEPVDDIYGGADYKCHLVGVLVRDALDVAVRRAKKKAGGVV